MKRWLMLAALALSTTGAAPPAFPPIVLPGTFSSAQTGQAARFSAYTPAPVPDIDLEPPQSRNSQPGGAELTPRLLRAQKKLYLGEGYMPGSSIDGEQQKRVKPLPGLNLSVPLN